MLRFSIPVAHMTPGPSFFLRGKTDFIKAAFVDLSLL